MTAKQLIKELQKMPPNSQVYVQSHDNPDYEYDIKPTAVWLIDFGNIPEDQKETAMPLKGKVVMIR